MFSHSFYLNLHLLGIFLTLTSVSGLAVMTIVGRDRIPPPWVRVATATHGVALLIVLLGGFGMLARLGMTGAWPGWVTAKLVIWVLFGASIALIKRRETFARLSWIGLPALAAVAAYLAIYKPF